MAAEGFRVMSDEAKEEIQKMIVNGLKVIDPPFGCVCSNCGLVPLFHYIFPCSHLYCRSCYTLYRNEQRNCRKCLSPFQDKTRQDEKVEQEIYNLKTECPNKAIGCTDKVTMQYQLEHRKNCKFSKERIENSQDKINDLENILAELKKQSSDIESIKTSQIANQTNYERLLKHIGSIEATVLKLTKNQGANANEIKSCNDKIAKLIDNHDELRKKFENRVSSANNGVLIWKITGYNQKKLVTGTDESDVFYSDGYKMKLVAQFDDDALNVGLRFVPSPDIPYLPTIYHHRRTFSILDQSDRPEKRSIVKSMEPRFRDDSLKEWMREDSNLFYRLASYQLLEGQESEVYLKNDCLYLKVVVEPIPLHLRDAFSNDGILIWKVTNYQRTKQESQNLIQEYVLSDYFYSSVHGYRMQCSLCFEEDKDFVFITLYFLEGEFDAALPDIGAHKVTFTILDQSDPEDGDNVQAECSLDPNKIGIQEGKRVMSRWLCDLGILWYSQFEMSPYLDNDSLLLRIETEDI